MMSPWKKTVEINSSISEIEREDGGFHVCCAPDVAPSAAAKLFLKMICIGLISAANHCINQSVWLHREVTKGQ